MNLKRLGKTELMVSEVGFGGIPLARISNDEAIRVVNSAIDLGINFFDTANAYQDSEYKIGLGIKNRRHEVILATKSTKRKKELMLADIDNSLKMLGTDYIDIFQIHQVSNDDDFDLVFSDGCAYEGALEAQKAGKIRHIGITSHRLKTAIALVSTNKFETIQFGFNLLEPEALEELFPLATQNDMGCIVMKPFAGGALTSARLCFAFLQNYPDYIPIPGISDVEEITEIVNLYEHKLPLTKNEINEINHLRTTMEKDFCRRCGYCDPCEHGVKVFVGVSTKRILDNYGVNYNPPWFTEAAESIDKCIECGVCEQRCPYNLPIRSMLKQNRQYYLEKKRK